MQDIGKKLQLKPGNSVLLLNAPDALAEALAAEAYAVVTAASAGASYDAVQLFVQTRQELLHFAPLAVAALRPSGLLWVAYPKKSSGIKSDMTRDEGWQALAELQYQPVRQVSLDDVWSSLRFKHQAERKAPSKFGVDLPGIDRKTKTVVPPEDLQQALRDANVQEAFQRLAFTHRKEYVAAVLEAKRPETRAKRIVKTIEQLKGKAAKA